MLLYAVKDSGGFSLTVNFSLQVDETDLGMQMLPSEMIYQLPPS